MGSSFPSTLPDRMRRKINVLMFLYHVSDRNKLFPNKKLNNLSQQYVHYETALLSSFRDYFSDINNDFCISICSNYYTYNVAKVEERLTVLKKICDKHVTFMNENSEICGAYRPKTTFREFCLSTDDPIFNG